MKSKMKSKMNTTIMLAMFVMSIGLSSCSHSEDFESLNNVDTQLTKTKSTKKVVTEGTGKVVVYIDPKNYDFSQLVNYKLDDESLAIDYVCIFAANFVLAVPPYLKAQNNPDSRYSFNKEIRTLLTEDISKIRNLQQKGTKVLLTILGGHHEGGWSNFRTNAEAQQFVDYIKTNVIEAYDLDGIDIDDEYSRGTPNDESLIKVTKLMRQAMPDKLITKALWSDFNYFKARWREYTLAQNLDFGAEMTYSDPKPSGRLNPYLQYGMDRTNLLLGFSAENSSYKDRWEASKISKKVITEGYGGCMLYNFGNVRNSIDMLEGIVHGIHGEWHDWNHNNR